MSSPRPASGQIKVPGDKSITHRAILFSALAEGTSKVRTEILGRDNLASLRVISQLGAEIKADFSEKMFALGQEEKIPNLSKCEGEDSEITIEGRGIAGLSQPDSELDCGNSGTTSRLLTGILAGQNFSCVVTGDESLRTRPFKRVNDPLSQMGAKFSSDKLPMTIEGGNLKGIEYHSPRASAQVKSAILLAGLHAEGTTVVEEPRLSRDHTERMLESMGGKIEKEELDSGAWRFSITGGQKLAPLSVEIPGDFSSASFFMVLASIVDGSSVLIKNVGFNPSRFGLFLLLKRMGASIEIQNERVVGGEPVADIAVSAAELSAIEVVGSDVVLAIDEIPIFGVAAAFAEGVTEIREAEELRVKESDRLRMLGVLLHGYGVNVEERPDGILIEGNPALFGSGNGKDFELPKTHDHRMAMSESVLRYATLGEFRLLEEEAVETSFPNFSKLFQQLTA